MYKPDSGKIIYGKGRICIAFAHYNHFDNYPNGTRNDHTADGILTVSEDNGQNDLLASIWSCSHSLDQRLLYDGSIFIESSVGDAYPKNIVIR